MIKLQALKRFAICLVLAYVSTLDDLILIHVSQAQRPLSAREIAQTALPSTVHIFTFDRDGNVKSSGSGFFIEQDIIVTNYHVIEDADQIKVKVVGNKQVLVASNILAMSEAQDLALIKIPARVGKPLPLGDVNKIAVGDVVYAVGNPEGLEGTFSEGIISRLRSNIFIQITAPISHGSSGGPVLNRLGQVIGVAAGTIKEGQNLNFAIPVLHINSLISKKQSPRTTRQSAPNLNVKSLPKNAEEWLQEGLRLLRRNDNERAVYAFKQSIVYKPESDTYLYLGDAYRGGYDPEVPGQKEPLKLAIEAYKESIRIRPNNDDAYCGIGGAYWLSGSYDEAIDAYSKAIKINPNNSDAYVGLGDSYFWSRSYELAIGAYRQAILINPTNGEAYGDLGFAYNTLGRFEEALEAYQKAVQVAPYDSHAYVLLANAYQLAKYPQADKLSLDALKQAIRINPKYSFAYHELGKFYKDRGRYQEAIETFKLELKVEPNNSDVYEEIGNIHATLKLFDEAIIHYKKAIEMNGHEASYYHSLGQVFYQLKRYEEALEAYRQAAILAPNHGIYHSSLGFIYYEFRNYGEAIKSFKNAVRSRYQSVSNDFIHYYLGLAYVAIGDKSSAFNEHRILNGINRKLADDLLNAIQR